MTTLNERLFKGDQVTVVLEPDTDNPGLSIPMAPYKENLFLPFLCSDGTRLIGAARPAQNYVSGHGAVTASSGFVYVDGFPIYLNYAMDGPVGTAASTGMSVNALGARGYNRMTFAYRNKSDIVWSNLDGSDDLSALEESIEAGNEHFVVFKDRYGYIRSYPIDLIFAYKDGSGFELFTESVTLPSVFLDPITLFDKLQNAFAEELQNHNDRFGIKINTDTYCTKYRLDHTGMVKKHVPGGFAEQGISERIAILSN